MGRFGDGEMGRLGGLEIGRLGDGEIWRWGDLEMGRFGDGEMGRLCYLVLPFDCAPGDITAFNGTFLDARYWFSIQFCFIALHKITSQMSLGQTKLTMSVVISF